MITNINVDILLVTILFTIYKLINATLKILRYQLLALFNAIEIGIILILIFNNL